MNGLGAIEKFWLNALREAETDREQVMRRFWNENPTYGLGDFQLLHTLNDLKQAGLIHENGLLRLTNRGEAVLVGQENYRNFAPRPRWLGGVELTP